MQAKYNWRYTVTQILANKIVITTFSLVPVKYGINHTAAMGIFVRVVKQVWYYNYNPIVKELIRLVKKFNYHFTHH